MTKVFIGGSRSVSRLNDTIRNRLLNIIGQGYIILIGDANGADKAVQKFLFEENYKDISVYCSGKKCRNNVGGWDTVNIEPPSNLKSMKFYMVKDFEMAKAADYGFMLWDGKSAGTLNNILMLLKLNKKSLVYFSPRRQFYAVSCLSDLDEIFKICNPENLLKIEKKINYKKIKKEIFSSNQMTLPL